MDERKKEEIHTTTTVTTPQTPDHFSQQQSMTGAPSTEESIILATSPVHFRFEENKFPSKLKFVFENFVELKDFQISIKIFKLISLMVT